MTPEFESKVHDAVKLVLEEIQRTVDSGFVPDLERKAFREMSDLNSAAEEQFFRGSMAGQKRYTKELAATAILYMVKFL